MEQFNDYYEIIQVSLNADFETIERVYRLLAKWFHPDNRQSGDAGRFRVLSDAYHTLSDPEKRASYDAHHSDERKRQWKIFSDASDERLVKTDREMQTGIMSLLYSARRKDVVHPGMGMFELARLLGCPEKHMEFHAWYLKEKGWIRLTDSGQYAITVEGVDVAISDGLNVGPDHMIATNSQSDEKQGAEGESAGKERRDGEL
jgi:curved DNA-binding protein CbpA